MKLTYRGVSYEPKIHCVETSESNIFVKYRGIGYNYRRSIPASQPGSQLLKYRGLNYNTCDLHSIDQPVEQEPASIRVPLLKWFKLTLRSANF